MAQILFTHTRWANLVKQGPLSSGNSGIVTVTPARTIISANTMNNIGPNAVFLVQFRVKGTKGVTAGLTRITIETSNPGLTWGLNFTPEVTLPAHGVGLIWTVSGSFMVRPTAIVTNSGDISLWGYSIGSDLTIAIGDSFLELSELYN